MVQKSIIYGQCVVYFPSKNLCVGMADNAYDFYFSF